MKVPWQPVPGVSSQRTVSYAPSMGNKQPIHWLALKTVSLWMALKNSQALKKLLTFDWLWKPICVWMAVRENPGLGKVLSLRLASHVATGLMHQNAPTLPTMCFVSDISQIFCLIFPKYFFSLFPKYFVRYVTNDFGHISQIICLIFPKYLVCFPPNILSSISQHSYHFISAIMHCNVLLCIIFHAQHCCTMHCCTMYCFHCVCKWADCTIVHCTIVKSAIVH